MIGQRRWRRIAPSVLLVAFVAAGPAASQPTQVGAGYAQRPEVRAFISELVDEEGFEARALRRLFAQARYESKVIAAISRPVVSPPKWYEYAPRFLEAARVEAEVEAGRKLLLRWTASGPDNLEQVMRREDASRNM